ncbi:MAG: hypothetical protein WBP13_10180 [Methylophilaceae bacterium]
MIGIENWPIVREGVWLYDCSVKVTIHILLSNETWGSGDYEDDEIVRENQSIQCYFIAYESAGNSGVFNNLIPNFESLQSALEYAESNFSGIEWRSDSMVDTASLTRHSSGTPNGAP